MKVLLRYLSAFVLLGMVASGTACTDPTDNGSYVEPITLYEKIAGEWKITGIAQIDETAKTAGVTPNEISLLDRFGFDALALSLKVDAEGQPTSYAVTGGAPELFPATGYWELNAPFPAAGGSAPVIYLYSDAARSAMTGKLTVSAVPGATPTMDLTLSRSVNGVPFVSYRYKFATATPTPDAK